MSENQTIDKHNISQMNSLQTQQGLVLRSVSVSVFSRITYPIRLLPVA